MNQANLTQSAFEQLSDLFLKQINSLDKATAYLTEIKSSIEANDLEALKRLIQQNNIPLSQIEEHEKARFELIKHYGFENTKAGITQCVASFDDGKKSLQALHDRLNKALSVLQKATTVSDLLITKNKQRVKQSLSILTGTSLKTDPTYSSTGNNNQDSLIRPLAIA